MGIGDRGGENHSEIHQNPILFASTSANGQAGSHEKGTYKIPFRMLLT